MKALFVVDMQNDFVDPKGKLPVPDAQKIVKNIKGLIAGAWMGYIVLGSVDRHFEDDLELKQFPPHCMDGTEGQKIIKEMFCNERVPQIAYIPNKIGKWGMFDPIQNQELIELIKNIDDEVNGIILFEKQTTDVFTNPHIDFVLEKLAVDEVIVAGIATDYCVKEAVLGFLKRGIKTLVVSDAIMGIDFKGSISARSKMESEGAIFITMEELLYELEKGRTTNN